MADSSCHSLHNTGEQEDDQHDGIRNCSSPRHPGSHHHVPLSPSYSHSHSHSHRRVTSIHEETAARLSFDRESSTSASASESGTVGGISDRVNQVHFVMDLFHQRVDQSHRMAAGGFVPDPILGSDFGMVEQFGEAIGINSSGLEVEELIGLGFESELNMGGVVDRDEYWGGFVVSDCGDDFYVARRENEICNGIDDNDGFSCDRDGRRGERRREDGFSSDGLDLSRFEANMEENADEMLGMDFRSEADDDYAADIGDEDYMSIPLCWHSLVLDEHRGAADELEWEEVDSRTEGLSNTVDFTEAASEPFSVLPTRFLELEEDEQRGRERGEGGGGGGGGSRNVGWAVLIDGNNLERSIGMEGEDGFYFGVQDDYNIYTAEYETMFGQFGDGDNAFLGNAPASRLVVENLPCVAVTDEDVKMGNALCAICKDDMEVGERPKQLPCSHQYHVDCILPWLGIKNTCPVCRYELPTDNPDYETQHQRGSHAM